MYCGEVKGRRYTWQVYWDEYDRKVWIRRNMGVLSGDTSEYVGKADSAKEALAMAYAHVNYS